MNKSWRFNEIDQKSFTIVMGNPEKMEGVPCPRLFSGVNPARTTQLVLSLHCITYNK